MSTTLSLQGVRGGVGVTTMIAALGHALHAQGERVLLVECSQPETTAGMIIGRVMMKNTFSGVAPRSIAASSME